MKMVFIKPEELRAWWGWVRPKLLQIQAKSPEPWIPEDIYADCHAGRSMLWIGMEGDQAVALAVLQPIGTSLHVWCGWMQSGASIEQALEHVRGIAQSGGATHITFESWRAGWARKARSMGFRPKKWILEV